MTTPQVSLLTPSATANRARHASTHPARAAATVMIGGYVVLTIVMLGMGLLLMHALSGSVGRWDEHVNQTLARHRTTDWNDVTKDATSLVNTLPAVAIAAVVAGVLALRRRFREAAVLVLALFLEITVFLSVTFVVSRPRPNVPRLNATPSTSSFPSGHTAAATVIFIGIAVIVACRTDKWLARVISAVAATAIVLLVGFGRVYRGMHHPSDVFAGLLLGLACLAVAVAALRTFAAARAANQKDLEDGVDTAEASAPNSCRRAVGRPVARSRRADRREAGGLSGRWRARTADRLLVRQVLYRLS